MGQENEYREYSSENINTYKKDWDKDFFRGVSLIDLGEILFIGIGIFTFLYLPWGFKVAFIVLLVLFYWFRTKWIENKIIRAKQFLVLGDKFIVVNSIGRGSTESGIKPQHEAHKRGFDDYISFLETQRNHLIARMIILNLFALVLLEIIRPK